VIVQYMKSVPQQSVSQVGHKCFLFYVCVAWIKLSAVEVMKWNILCLFSGDSDGIRSCGVENLV
jgi:hypothetical protein